jgi:cell wall-associated NlpC family hydrolase
MRILLVFLLLLPSLGYNQRILSIEESKRQEILQEAEKHLGKRYRTQYKNQVFDCSGFVRHCMRTVDKNVTRSSVSQVHDGKRILNIKDAKPGDILVFKGRNAKNNRPGHVGLVHHWSNDTLYFIHSSVAKGITIDNMFDPYYGKRFLQVRDIISSK